MKRKKSHNFAIVLFCLFVIAIFLFSMRPRLGVRPTPPQAAIENNLRIIESAKELWAVENQKSSNDFVALSDLIAFFKNKRPPESVLGEKYVLSTVGQPALAILPPARTLGGKPGPFTITSF